MVNGESPTQTMSPAVVARLLELNRRFYAAVGPEFDHTRASIPEGMARTLEALPRGEGTLRVLDAGCGNGRLARALEGLARPVEYIGVDGDAYLLARAREQTAGLAHVAASFVRADLADPGWADVLGGLRFDVAYCLATLHHFPGAAMRRRVLADLIDSTMNGDVIVGTWQFQNSPRLMARIQPWRAIGLSEHDVEPGDFLLPWDQGVHALRYVHLIGLEEIAEIVKAHGLRVRDHYLADGADGNGNLYVIIGPAKSGQPKQGVSREQRKQPQP